MSTMTPTISARALRNSLNTWASILFRTHPVFVIHSEICTMVGSDKPRRSSRNNFAHPQHPQARALRFRQPVGNNNQSIDSLPNPNNGAQDASHSGSSNVSLEHIQNCVNKLRNFFSQLIAITSQKHPMVISEQVKQAVANVISGNYSVEEFITVVARLAQCAPAQREMIDFIKFTLPYFRGNDESSKIRRSGASSRSRQSIVAINAPSGGSGSTIGGMGYPDQTQNLVKLFDRHSHACVILGFFNFRFSAFPPNQFNPMAAASYNSPAAAMYGTVNSLSGNTPIQFNNYSTQSNNIYSEAPPYNQNVGVTDQTFDSMMMQSRLLNPNNYSGVSQQYIPVSDLNDDSIFIVNNNNEPADIARNNAGGNSSKANELTIMDLKRKVPVEVAHLSKSSIPRRSRKKPKIEKPMYGNDPTLQQNSLSLEFESMSQNLIFRNEKALKQAGQFGDEPFFDIKHIVQQVLPLIQKSGLGVDYENLSVFCTLLSHALEHRLRNTMVDLSKQVHQRLITSNIQPVDRLKEIDSTISTQFSVLNEIANASAMRSKLFEEERMRTLSKSKSKLVSPEELRLKEQARQYLKDQEMMQATHAANVAAMQAIGDRRRKPPSNPNDPRPSETPGSASNIGAETLLVNSDSNNNSGGGGGINHPSTSSVDINPLNQFKQAKPKRVTQNRITVRDVQRYFENDPFSRNQSYYHDSINFD